VSRPQEYLSFLPVFQRKQCLAEGEVPSSLLPEFDGLKSGHEYFLPTGLIHFLANDLLDFAQGAPPQGQKGVDAGGDLFDHPGPQEELVADSVGLSGSLPLGLAEKLGETQRPPFESTNSRCQVSGSR